MSSVTRGCVACDVQCDSWCGKPHVYGWVLYKGVMGTHVAHVFLLGCDCSADSITLHKGFLHVHAVHAVAARLYAFCRILTHVDAANARKFVASVCLNTPASEMACWRTSLPCECASNLEACNNKC